MILNTVLGDAAPVIGGKPLAHFYIGLREVDAIANGQSTVLGSAATPVQVDLLQYQNGSTAWITQTNVPEQPYTQLRYVFDMGSVQAVFADGSTMPVRLSTAASKSSDGLGNGSSTAADATYADGFDVTVNAPFTVTSTGAAVAADFNLTESLAPGGPGALTLRPTIAAANGAGQIAGTVVNNAGSPVKNATIVAVGSNGAAINSATTDANGAFTIDALPADTYQVLIYNNYTNAAGYRINAAGADPTPPSPPGTAPAPISGPTATVTSGNSTFAGTIGD